jgi:hypothetical protein
VAPDDSRQNGSAEDATVAGLMSARITELSQQLQAHIADCSAQSRRLFWAVIGCLAWLVGNGLVLPVINKMFPG